MELNRELCALHRELSQRCWLEVKHFVLDDSLTIEHYLV
jgi:hypothetical protein